MFFILFPLALLLAFVVWVLLAIRQNGLIYKREHYIRQYTLPAHLFEMLMRRHGHLQIKDCQLVAQGMRQFFLAYLKSGQKYVSMPSQVVDDLWHEFILHTREYESFCKKAFGGLLHHTPAAVLGKEAAAKADAGLRRCWWYACREENIFPKNALRLPLLFALDAKLNISDGFHYVVDCTAVKRAGTDSTVYCGGDFASGVGSDGGGDSSGSDSASGCGGGDSSGGDSSSSCGGGGCGGGCGGGGGD